MGQRVTMPVREDFSSAILLVERDPDIALPIVQQLTADGYPTALAHTAQHARALAAISKPELLILGGLDPGDDSRALLAEVRGDAAHWPPYLPVIVLGPPADRLDPPADRLGSPTHHLGSPVHHLDLLRAFAAGADDYLAHPGESDPGHVDLSYLELRARLQALLRRATAAASGPRLPCLRIGPLHIDTAARAVLLHDHAIALRPREYALLLHLAHEPTRVFSKHDLLRALWGYHCTRTRTLDSHACRLRRKLASHAREPWVLSVWGVGYSLTE
jgi:DNA-binding response OmpR family regulator